jgi:hypothetical protein
MRSMRSMLGGFFGDFNTQYLNFSLETSCPIGQRPKTEQQTRAYNA